MDIPQPLPWEQRVNGAGPLPGGYTGYLGSFRTICERVDQGSVSYEELVAWARATFEISETSARHRLAFLRNAGLVRQSEGLVSVDERIRHWMKNGGDHIPIAMIHSRLKFVGEMLSELEEPKSAEALRKAASRYGLDWKTYTQINNRRGWLQSANLIEGAAKPLEADRCWSTSTQPTQDPCPEPEHRGFARFECTSAIRTIKAARPRVRCDFRCRSSGR